MKYIITLIIALVLSVANTFGQQDWRLRRDEDGIKVFSARSSSSDFQSVRVELMVNAGPAQLVALLHDVNTNDEWVYSSKASEIIKTVQPNEYSFYSQTMLPWPCANRDYIAHIVMSQPSPGMLNIESTSEPAMLPESDGVVRVKNHQAHWEVISLNKDQVKIVYTVHFDPGGAIPAWLANMFVTKGPFLTFRELRYRAMLPKYRNAHFDFIKD